MGKRNYDRRKHGSRFPLVLLVTLLGLLCSFVYAAPIGRKDASELPEPPLAGQCRIAINEISLQDLDNQFIELTKICKDPGKTSKAINMERYAIVFVDRNDYIIGICLLKGNLKVQEPVYYTIGTDTLENVDYKLSDCDVVTDLMHNRIDRFPGNMLKTPVFGVLLVRKEKITPFLQYKLVKLGIMKAKKKLSKMVKSTLISGIQDYYVITSSKSQAIPVDLQSFYSKYTNEDQLEMESNVQSANSLSRCVPASELSHPSSYYPMQPKYFKDSKPTPGSSNDCISLFAIPNKAPLKQGVPRVHEATQQNSVSETRSLPPVTAHPTLITMQSPTLQIKQKAIHSSPIQPTLNTIQSPPTQPTVNGIHSFPTHPTLTASQSPPNILLTDSTDSSAIIETESPTAETTTKSPRSYSYDVKPFDTFQREFNSETSLFWDDCSLFPADQITAMQELPFRPIDVQRLMKLPTCTWIQYIIPRKVIVCKLCRKLLSQKIIFDRPGLLNGIMKDGAGTFEVRNQEKGRRASTKNHQMILDHENSILHQMSVEFKNLFKSGLRDQVLLDAFQGPGTTFRSFIQSTMNLIISVLQSMKLNISFNTFSILMETLDYFKADTGHLYRNANGMRTVADSIGKKLHNDMIQTWLTERPHLSITLDTTTDITGYGILAIVFHTVEKSGNLKIYLYRMLHVPKGESGYGLFDQFLQALKVDGIEQWVKEKLVGLTTDGAPAVKGVLRRLLNGFADNEIVGVWCGAHKLERAAEKAFAQFEFLRDIDEFINSVYRMLSVKSPLRREEFREKIGDFNVRTFYFQRVQELRWLPFHVRALVPYITRLNVLDATLYGIITNPKIEVETRREAEMLLHRLKDATFLATLAFTADVLTVLADVSIQYQRHAGTLIGKKHLRTQTEKKLIALQSISGDYMEFLLDHSEILERRGEHREDNLDTLEKRIERFETSPVKFLGVQLNPPNNLYTEHRVHTKMQDYVDALLTQFDGYYHPDLNDNYDVFTPSLLPTSIDQIGDYGHTELKKLNKGFKWGINEENLLSEWKILLESLISQPTFPSMQSKYPEEFWVFYLKCLEVSWNTNIRNVISKALTIPSSSASCERSFSMYRFIKSYRRYSLLPPTVENLIRIKMNGKKDLKDWDIVEYTKDFITRSHSRADDSTRVKTIKDVCEREMPIQPTTPADIETCENFEEGLVENDSSFPIINTT